MTNYRSYDPYSPHVEPEEISTEEVVEAPKVEEIKTEKKKIEVPEGSVESILKWADKDKEKLQAALDVEKKGKKRSSLINRAEYLISQED